MYQGENDNPLLRVAPVKLTELANAINASIAEIREYIRIDSQELLLMIVSDLENFSNPVPEGDALIFEKNESSGRPLEYLQSLIAAQQDGNNRAIAEKDIEALAYRYLADYEVLYANTMRYLFYYSLPETDDLREKQQMLFEAQTLQMVRGNRYRFLHLAFYSPLLAPHDEEFRKLFSVSADEIVSGFGKLEAALAEGRLNAVNALAEIFERYCLEDFDDPNFSTMCEEDIEAVSRASMEAFSIHHFDVERITGWPKKLCRRLSFMPGEASFYESGEHAYWPIMALPIVDRPFITLHDSTYCFDYYTLVDRFYRSIQKMILELDPGYTEIWQAKQKEASEEMVESILRQLLPGCITYRDNYYGSRKDRKENDLLIQYHDALLVVEVKAGQFTIVPPISDIAAHIQRYKGLIQNPNSQCHRLRQHIKESGTELSLFESDGTVKAAVDLSNIYKVYCVSATIENINSFASRAEKLSFLNLEEGVACISVDELLVYANYFDNPLEFLHFLRQREIAAVNPRLVLNDELDHLGMYIAHNCYSIEVDSIDEPGILHMMGYREEIDEYFERVNTPLPSPEKPRQIMHQRFKEIIDHLAKNTPVNCVQASSYLLDFSSETREQLGSSIDRVIERQSNTKRQCFMTFAGKETSIRLTYFVTQDCLEDADSFDGMRDVAASTMLSFGERDRALLSLHYDTNNILSDVQFEILTPDVIPPDRAMELKQKGDNMGNIRVDKYRKEHRKIGRNELCPCGSGKKYKRCHGA